LIDLTQRGSLVPVIASSASYDDRLPALVAGGSGSESAGIGLFKGLIVADSPPAGEHARMAELIDRLASDGIGADQHFLAGYRSAAAFDRLLRDCLASGRLTRNALRDQQIASTRHDLILGEPVTSGWFESILLVNLSTAPGSAVIDEITPFGTRRLTLPLFAPVLDRIGRIGNEP